MPSKLPAELRRSHRTIKDWISSDMPLSGTDVRRYAVLNHLIRGLEARGIAITAADGQNAGRYLEASQGQGTVAFRVRERLRQHRRPLTSAEQAFNFIGQTSVFSLIPSGFLEFETGHWQRSKVIEEKVGSLIDQISVMSEVILEAIDRDIQRKDADRRAAAVRAQRDEERAILRKARERNEARWQTFLQLAEQWSEIVAAKAFLDELEKHVGAKDAHGSQVLDWARAELQNRDPLGSDKDILGCLGR